MAKPHVAHNKGTENIFIAVPRWLFALLVFGVITIALVLIYQAFEVPLKSWYQDFSKTREIQHQQIEVDKANAALALEREAEDKAREAGAEWGKTSRFDVKGIPLGTRSKVSTVNGDTIEGYLASRSVLGGADGKSPKVINGVKRFLEVNYPDRWWVFLIQFEGSRLPYSVVIVQEADGAFRELTGEEIANQIKRP